MSYPLISCIMPCSRPGDLPRAIEVFLSQDYENKELIIVGDIPIETTKWLREMEYPYIVIHTMSVGARRNAACGMARGEIIFHQDSDDYYAPDYLSRAYRHLIDTNADVTGLSSAYFFQPPNDLRLYEYKGQQPYVIGSGMMYYRRVWENNPFKSISEGEDAKFCANAGIIKPHGYLDGFIAMIHGNNTASHKQFNSMRAVSPEIAKQILGTDWGKY